MNILEVILSMMIGTPSEREQAKDSIKSFCEAHLIADDPWPHADTDTDSLIDFYNRTGDESARKELKFRLDAGRLNSAQIVGFFKADGERSP